MTFSNKELKMKNTNIKTSHKWSLAYWIISLGLPLFICSGYWLIPNAKNGSELDGMVQTLANASMVIGILALIVMILILKNNKPGDRHPSWQRRP
jgi:peptidoglycan/LPS O-acetylase OafA/YrhL